MYELANGKPFKGSNGNPAGRADMMMSSYGGADNTSQAVFCTQLKVGNRETYQS